MCAPGWVRASFGASELGPARKLGPVRTSIRAALTRFTHIRSIPSAQADSRARARGEAGLAAGRACRCQRVGGKGGRDVRGGVWGSKRVGGGSRRDGGAGRVPCVRGPGVEQGRLHARAQGSVGVKGLCLASTGHLVGASDRGHRESTTSFCARFICLPSCDGSNAEARTAQNRVSKSAQFRTAPLRCLPLASLRARSAARKAGSEGTCVVGCQLQPRTSFA